MPFDHTEGIPAQVGAPCSPLLTVTTFYLGHISGTEPKNRNGVKSFMAMVIIYLILLSIGAGLLVMEGKAVLGLSGPSEVSEHGPE